jgi:metallophosphoesterase (TIGR00282 family)
MKILFIGDIVGNPGRGAVKYFLPKLKKEHQLDFIIANAENAAGGSGITVAVAEELFKYGVSVLTSGDHIWKKKDVFDIIDKEERLLRPLNFPRGAPGRGFGVFQLETGDKVGVINLQGRVFMEALDSPFQSALEAQKEIALQTKIIIVDIHAEATSEKIALGWYLDGLVSAVIGTHTHIQTADEKILPKGTAYITDAGMVGPYNSVIGRKIEDVLERFITSIPRRFEIAEGDVQLHGVVLDIDEKSGQAKSIIRIQEKLNV